MSKLYLVLNNLPQDQKVIFKANLEPLKKFRLSDDAEFVYFDKGDEALMLHILNGISDTGRVTTVVLAGEFLAAGPLSYIPPHERRTVFDK